MAYKQQTVCLLPAVLEAQDQGSSLVMGGPTFRFIFAVTSCDGRNLEALWASLVRALIPFLRASPSQPNHLRKAHLLTPSKWALEHSMDIWGTHSVYSRRHGKQNGSSCQFLLDLRQLLDFRSHHIFKFKSFLKMSYQVIPQKTLTTDTLIPFFWLVVRSFL